MRIIQRIDIKIIAFLLIIVLGLSCEKDKTQVGFYDENLLSISRYIENNPEKFSRFMELMVKTNLYHSLNAYNSNGNGFTLFLPTDDAFDEYIESTDKYADFDELLNDPDFSRVLPRFHLVNRSFRTTDFPYGALSDTTFTGDFLTIGFQVTEDSSSYWVNNEAVINQPNVEVTNGIIHELNAVLEPIYYSSYDWLNESEGYSIISGALEITGIKDEMGIYKTGSTGQSIRNVYTVLAEHDSIYERSGISSVDDLIAEYGTPGLTFTNPENGLYQFAAYHLLENSYFLDEFSGSSNYNTRAVYPVSIIAGLDIQINTGVDTFGLEINGSDTTIIKHIGVYYQESNVATKNGPIHFIREVMELYKPRNTERTFQFYEEPLIEAASKNSGSYQFVDQSLFSLLSWYGPEAITYEKSSSSNGANSKDYLEIVGEFSIEYTIPKILSGKYLLSLKVDMYDKDRARSGDNNPTVQVYVDGKQIGGNFDLSTGGTDSKPFNTIDVGSVEFLSYTEHQIEIRSLIPGRLRWDFVRLSPE